MASTADFVTKEINGEFDLVENYIHICLSVLEKNNVKRIGFDHKMNPIFDVSTPQDKIVYANLLKAVDILCQLLYASVGNHIHIEWIQKPVFDEENRLTEQTRLSFKVVSA